MGDTAPSNKQEPLRTERKILKKMMSKALPGFERPFKDSFPQLWDGYKLIIAEPMDFGTIRRKLKEVLYMPATGHVIHPDFIREMELVYTNCIHYNAPETEYYVHAQHMLELFRRKVKEKTERGASPTQDMAAAAAAAAAVAGAPSPAPPPHAAAAAGGGAPERKKPRLMLSRRIPRKAKEGGDETASGAEGAGVIAGGDDDGDDGGGRGPGGGAPGPAHDGGLTAAVAGVAGGDDGGEGGGGSEGRKQGGGKRSSSYVRRRRDDGLQQRLWESELEDLRREVPCTQRAVSKGGPTPLKSRDLRQLAMSQGGGGGGADNTAAAAAADDSSRRSSSGVTRPLWVSPDGRIFLEVACPNFRRVEDFLVAIAEPENRPSHMHEYQMTMHSLYAAASMGLTFKRIVRQLQAWSKTMISPELEDWIKEQTGRYGKVKLVLRQDEHYVETAYKDVMRKLLKDDRVRKCREIGGDAATTSGVVTDTLDLHAKQFEEYADDDDAEDIYFETVETQEGLSRHKKKRKLEIERFAVAAGCYREIKKACLDLGYPLIEEYDYLNDRKPLRGVSWRESLSTESWRTGLQLRSVDNIRDYQAKCLNKMFGANRRARSGLIVLPCGAGKTFVGINAACTINKKTIILCPDGLSKNQWDYQFRIWTNMEKAQVTVEGFTSHELRELGTGEDALAEVRRMMTADIILTTYSAITAGRTDQIGKARKVMMEELEKYEFGLLIMDEVHILPAATFQKSLDKIKAHAKLGLTATLVREDNKIDDLRFLIGPKIFEANWLELQRAGYLARVECHEVQCPMTAEFYDGYLQAGISRLRKEMLYILNPSKIMAAHYLIQQHSQRGHKIIVFSDRIFPLHVLSQALLTWGLKDIGMIEGKCQAWERDQIIKDFKNNPKSHVILLSKVGDAALDMPDSNVIIQISASGGSRKQEAQRLGRILRPKSKMSYGDETQAWFYSLVSQDTVEMRYSTKRQQYLVDQGYAFHVNTPGEGGICALAVAESRAREQDGRRGLLFSKLERQQALLRRILQDTAEEDLDIQEDDDQKSLAKAERDRDGILPPSQRQKRNRPATKVNVDLSSNKKKIVSAVIKKKR